MAEGSSTLPIIQTVLLAGVLVSTAMVTCSNSRLEGRVIALEKKEPPQAPPVSTEKLEASIAELRDAIRTLSTRQITVVEGTGTPTPGTPTSSRVPGQPSDVEAVGWGGRRAKVLYVEGAVPNAPLRLQDKPMPQNDWYVTRRGSPPSSLNYYASNEGETSTITPYTLGRLLQINLDHPPDVEPGLATSWEVGDDKLTYTYRLRHGVLFADGRPFTSADVRFSFDVIRDSEVQCDHIRSNFDDVESLATPDDYTVVVKYRRKYWKGLYTVGFVLRVLNKGWYEEQIPVYAKQLDIKDYSTEPGKPGFGAVFNKIRIPCPGTGAYYLRSEEDKSKDFLNFVQNPFYWGIQVKPTWYNFTQLRWLFIPDDIAANEEFRKQAFDVQVTDFDAWDDQLSKDPTITSISKYFEYDHMGLAFSYISWNCRQPPFDDPRVRTAMTHLTDRAWILKDIERGRGQVAVCPSKPIYPEYSHDLVPHAFDPEKAKALLAEAGWRDTDGDGVLDRDGKPFEFEFKYPTPRRFYVRIAGVLEDACKKIGIRMKQRPLEWSVFYKDLRSDHHFDAVCLNASFADPWVDPYEDFHSSQDVPDGGNECGWRDPRADDLLERMREEFDPEKRAALFQQFNRLYYDAQPQTLLIHALVPVLQTKRFENVRIRPTGMQLVEFWVKPENVRHR